MVTRISVGELRRRTGSIMRRVANGDTFVVIDGGREVARIAPIEPPSVAGRRLLGCLAGTAEIHGDIEAPIGSPGCWFRELP